MCTTVEAIGHDALHPLLISLEFGPWTHGLKTKIRCLCEERPPGHHDPVANIPMSTVKICLHHRA
eukprot:268905-Pyramimonas_sp.AAC.1